jgi:hypothetical protein
VRIAWQVISETIQGLIGTFGNTATGLWEKGPAAAPAPEGESMETLSLAECNISLLWWKGALGIDGRAAEGNIGGRGVGILD